MAKRYADELGGQLHTDGKNVYRLESGTENVALVRLNRIAEVLDVSVGALIDGILPANTWDRELEALGWHAVIAQREGKPLRPSARANTKVAAVPVLDLRPVGGAVGARDEPSVLGHVTPAVGRRLSDGGLFLAKVVGDSMTPRIPPDTWCLFSRAFTESQLLGVDVLVAEREPGGLTAWIVKRVAQIAVGHDDRRTVLLQSANRSYPPREIHVGGSEALHIAAVVREVLRSPRAD